MRRHEEYLAGPHHGRTHFWCGLIFGAVIGAWVGSWAFEGGRVIAITAVVVAFTIAYSCARWGDPAWHWIIKRLPWG